MTHIACDALQAGKRLELRYDGVVRLVEVHAVGLSQAGAAVMRVWQVSGGSRRLEGSGWKLMRLDQGSSLRITEFESSAPRPGYKRGDKAMVTMFCQI